MSRNLIFSMMILAMAMLLAACGGSNPGSAGSSENGGETEPLKVVLLVNGVLGDKSFFDSARRGLERAERELGVQAKIIEVGIEEPLWEPALIDAAANEDFDVLILGTFPMVPYLQQIAPQYPAKKFIIFDALVDYENCDCDNVYSVLYKQNEGSYLAGVYAAAMTTQPIDGFNPAPIIGSVGGQEIDIILDFMVGYEQGAKDTNPDVTVIRQFAGSWFDPAKGKELAKAQYNQGADIIFQIAAGTGQGVFEAAAEDGHYAIGVDSDQALIVEEADPDQAARILTSMVKNVDNSLFRALDLHLKGELPYGQVEFLGIAEGGVGLARNKFYDAVTPEEVKALIDEAEQKIVNGDITVETVY